jgi:two-component system sensor histidine kinase KdpD
VSLIDEQATRLATLTHQALSTAKFDEGQLKVDHENLCMDQLFQFCRAEAIHTLTDHPLRIIDETSSGHVWADARLLEMALLQMLDNCFKICEPWVTHHALRQNN